MHFKHITINGKQAYTVSASLAGAGLGMPVKDSPNFESGIVTNKPEMVYLITKQFDEVWMGKYCRDCKI